MLVLGTTSDDKGAQLEHLIRTVLQRQGYVGVRSNVVGAGGNELDVEAERRSELVGGIQTTPLICEAKAYADAVNMPVWQKFLGKVFISRSTESTTVGLLVALNGMNGNVAGSYKDLKSRDASLFVFEGSDLEAIAESVGEIVAEEDVRSAVEQQFGRAPEHVETGYYGGNFYWVVSWERGKSYSVVDGRGGMLPMEEIERLRLALENCLPGALLATDEAQAEAEARHDERLELIGRLFRGETIPTGSSRAADELAEEPFCAVESDQLGMIPASSLDAAAVSRLFVSMMERPIAVGRLSFMLERHHAPYVERLVQLVPDLQRGFALDEGDSSTLVDLAIAFPSVWATLSRPIAQITTHRADPADVVDEAVLAADHSAFWEVVLSAVRSDYFHPRLGPFIYDYMNVAELQECTVFTVKGKEGPVGRSVSANLRTAVRRFSDESMAEADEPTYVLVRILPTVPEPWDEQHADPAFPLD